MRLAYVFPNLGGRGMFSKYIDLENETLINHCARLSENSHDISLIYKIYMNTKNYTNYVPNNVLQKASETLVMGRGNNFSKNILLFSLLKINGFECELKYKYIVDNSKVIACRNNIIIPWFFVHVNYLGKNLELDCSLDGAYQKAAGVAFDENDMEYSVEKYMVNDMSAFAPVSIDGEDSEEKVLKILTKQGRAQIYSRARGIVYV